MIDDVMENGSGLDERGGVMHEEQDLDELLAPLRSDLASLRADSTALQVELAVVRREGVRAAQALSLQGSEIDAVKETVTATHEILIDFVARYGRHQIVANAQAELTQLTVAWKADFAHRQRVRALARGLTHALTSHAVAAGLVDQNTIDACVREQFLTEPTYWLAPAIMAVAARHNAESGPAARATAHAVWLDSAKAKLFFALTCSGQGRLSEAAGWMDRYLNSLNRDDLGPEFAVVLEAIANAELGFDAYTYAREAMARWFREDRSGFARALPAGPHQTAWGHRLMALGSEEGSKERFGALRRLTGLQWPGLENGWRCATALDGTLNFLESFPKINDQSVQKGHYTNGALEHLIDQLEQDESELHDRMARLRSLIEKEGDVSAAAKAAEESRQANEPLDFVTLLEWAVFEPEQLQLGVAARRLALDCVWESVYASVVSMARTSRSLLPATITLSVDDWSCEYPTSPSQVFDVRRHVDELTMHVKRRTDQHIESIVPAWSLTVGACLLAAADGALIVPFVNGGFILIFSALLGALVLLGLAGIAHVPLRRRSVRDAGNKQRQYASHVLGQSAREMQILLDDWRHGLRSFAALEEWQPASNGAERD
ncbi:hypothetical protein ACFWFU_05460 [Streptomyces sp. NPDC060235]|uniref:hypothetical protein n=1 Tax=Streptomyces sp. NPDC060235 TaxID=3347080 RepID=UPI0036526DB2